MIREYLFGVSVPWLGEECRVGQESPFRDFACIGNLCILIFVAFREDLDALILACLASGPAHGYELSKRIRALSDDVLSVAEGKLYPALHSLENGGDIAAEWVGQGNKPPRKVYELTTQGHTTLREKQTQWRSFSQGIESILNSTPKAVETK